MSRHRPGGHEAAVLEWRPKLPDETPAETHDKLSRRSQSALLADIFRP